MRKAFICFILIAIVLAFPFADEITSDLGKPMKDFSIRTVDGWTFTLSEQLKTHDLVFVNNWATWCTWCEAEFPALQAAADMYADRVAVIAVSCSPADSDEDILAFAEDNDLHLTMARDDYGIFSKYVEKGVPTSLVIDRFGNIACVQIGAITSDTLFKRLFNYFLRENYPATKVIENLKTLGMEKISRQSSEELSKAANMKGGKLVFRNSDNTNILPFNTYSENGRTGLVSTNSEHTETISSVLTNVTAPVGGSALTFDFEINEAGGQEMTLFEVCVDGNPVKRYGARRELSSYAISLTPGEHEISFNFYNNSSYDGDCYVRISNVGLRSGYSARQALSAIPATPVADDFEIQLLSHGIEMIRTSGSSSILEEVFGDGLDYVILNSDKAEARITVTEAMDPDMVFVISSFETPETLGEFKTDDKGFTFTLETHDGMGGIIFVSYAQINVTDSATGFIYFSDRETAANLFDALQYFDPDFSYEIVPFTGFTTPENYLSEDESESTYRIKVVDQYGAPVSGVAVNFCSDTTCRPVFTGSDGYAVYTDAPYNYHMQIIKVPKGYSYDRYSDYFTSEESGEYELRVTRN